MWMYHGTFSYGCDHRQHVYRRGYYNLKAGKLLIKITCNLNNGNNTLIKFNSNYMIIASFHKVKMRLLDGNNI